MEREEVIKNIRACLMTSKGGIKIENLSRDYKMLIDENIPFRKLGFQSLVAFLHTVPSVILTERGNEYFVEAIPSEEAAHITKLIARQKTTTKKHKKFVHAQKPTPFRQPVMTKKSARNARSGNDNMYSQMSGRQHTSFPALSTKITIHQNNEKPRYIQSTSGIPLSSPSKRLKDKQMNSVLSANQSINKQRDDSQVKINVKATRPVICQKPKTANNNTEMLPKKNLSERLKFTPNIPPLLNLQNNTPIPSHQSDVLSPLSPGQVLADSSSMQFQQPLTNPSIPQCNPRKIVPKSQLIDPRDELKKKAIDFNLSGPIYQICPATIKNTKEPSVFAQVKIGPYGYSSYPEEARSEDEAQKLAAKIALLDLTAKYGSPSCLNETKDRSLIKERILSIVDAHRNGIFMHQVPIYYKQRYGEILPGNWEKAVEASPDILLEKGVDNSVILRRFVSPPEKARSIGLLKTDKVQLNPIGPVAPGQLQLPEEDVWVVYVTCVVSVVEIWVKIIDDAYSEQLYAMTTEMTQYYNKIEQPLKPSMIESGNYYVVFEDESYHRVRCVDYDNTNGMVSVSFIDHGDEDTFHHSKLQTLDKKFCALPAQAIRLSLSGLEDFSGCDSIVGQVEKLLLDRAWYAEVVNRNKDQNEISATVLLYDTHGPEDINLNSEIANKILQNPAIAPKLDVEGQVCKVFISHVEQNGDVYIQVQSEGMKLLISLLNRLICTRLNSEDLEDCVVTSVDPSKTYFVSVNNNWYRGKIVGNRFYDQLRVFLIDFGKTVSTTKSNLLSLEKLSETLSKFPAQALKVHLHNIDKSMFNEKIVAKLAEFAPKGEPLVTKVVSSENGTPVVKLFKRIQSSNMLVSINDTLALEEELTKTQGDGNNNIKPKKRVERMNSKLLTIEDDEVKSLKPPKISGIGEYFDVHITMAAHPGNFTIQPFDDKPALEKMMIQLQESCRAYKGPVPIAESIREGKLYAAKHTDQHWYRVCVSSIIKENMVSVYFCDFGDVSVLPLDKLQPLKSQFLELPYQAIKARLAGIRPINVDWSVEDSLRFQELVVEKNFVSIIVESKPDGLSPADTILGLKLIDVKTSNDIYIHQLLVEEGRATYTDEDVI